MKTRAALPHLHYPQPAMQRRQINAHAFETGGGPWSPLDLSPSLWLDGSDATTFYDAVSGGSNVVADGTIARWEDKSGNARHFTQSSSGIRPIYKAAFVNGLSAVNFASTSSALESTYTINSGAFSVAIVYYVQTTGHTNRVLQGGAGASSANWLVGAYNPQVRAYGGGGFTGGPTTVANQVYVQVVTQASGTGTMTNRVDGVAASSVTASTYPQTLGLGGGGDYASEGHQGPVCELIISPAIWTAGEITEIETYLAAKWQ